MKPDEDPRRANIRIALILAGVALAFFIGIIVKFKVYGP